MTLSFALAFVLAFQAEVAKPYRIPSSSMEPTLHCARPSAWCRGRMSDRVIANRLAYRFREPRRSDPGSAGSWRVPPGHYFFLGDNRAHSCDSRVWASVPRENLIGPVTATYWPPNRLRRP